MKKSQIIMKDEDDLKNQEKLKNKESESEDDFKNEYYPKHLILQTYP